MIERDPPTTVIKDGDEVLVQAVDEGGRILHVRLTVYSAARLTLQLDETLQKELGKNWRDEVLP